MKKIINVLAVIAAVTLPGCTKEHSPEVNSDGEMVLVHLKLGGEIDVEETPLTRAFTSDDLIGVQVYQGSDYYAYGLFDDVSKMKIYLHSGKTYKFVCTVVKNGKSILNLNSSGYREPFYRNGKRTALGNPFIYTNSAEYSYDNLASGKIYNKSGALVSYGKADRFYGEVSGFTPSNESSLSIPMKRVSFGVSISVSGITDGNVTVTIKNNVQTFHTNSNITQDTEYGTTTWSFNDLKSAWQYTDNYAENFTVGVVWNRGVGVTQDLGTKTVQFKRNAVNHVKINLSSSTKASGVAVSLEEPVITNETYSIGN